MTIACKTLAVASTTALLGLFALCCQSANAATTFWDLKFFDDGENAIGTGWFSYDNAHPSPFPQLAANVKMVFYLPIKISFCLN